MDMYNQTITSADNVIDYKLTPEQLDRYHQGATLIAVKGKGVKIHGKRYSGFRNFIIYGGVPLFVILSLLFINEGFGLFRRNGRSLVFGLKYNE